MRIKIIFLAVLLGVVSTSCKQEKKEQLPVKKVVATKVLKDYMLGNWETNYIRIEYPTYKNSDSTFVFEDDFSKPNTGKAQSNYKNDGTFTAWFLQANGKKVGESAGIWKTKGDSLFVAYPYLGKNVEVWYRITQTQEGFKGKVIYDWDNDTAFDDVLLMKSKKITQANK